MFLSADMLWADLHHRIRLVVGVRPELQIRVAYVCDWARQGDGARHGEFYTLRGPADPLSWMPLGLLMSEKSI